MLGQKRKIDIAYLFVVDGGVAATTESAEDMANYLATTDKDGMVYVVTAWLGGSPNQVFAQELENKALFLRRQTPHYSEVAAEYQSVP